VAVLSVVTRKQGGETKMKRVAIHRKSGFRDPAFLFAALIIYFGVMPTRAYAYLDPGTGSFIFQILVGAIVGGMFFLKKLLAGAIVGGILFFKNFIASLKEKVARLFGVKPADDSSVNQSAQNDDSAGRSSGAATDDKTAVNNQAAGGNQPDSSQEKQS